MSVEQAIRDLHRGVQWKGWRLWAARFGHDMRAYMDVWCGECNKPWPCPTIEALTAHPTSPSAQCRGEGRGGAVSERESR